MRLSIREDVFYATSCPLQPQDSEKQTTQDTHISHQAAGRQDVFAGELGVVALVHLAHPGARMYTHVHIHTRKGQLAE